MSYQGKYGVSTKTGSDIASATWVAKPDGSIEMLATKNCMVVWVGDGTYDIDLSVNIPSGYLTCPVVFAWGGFNPWGGNPPRWFPNLSPPLVGSVVFGDLPVEDTTVTVNLSLVRNA